MKALFLDPGSWETGWVSFDVSKGINAAPLSSGIFRNEELAEHLEITESVELVVSEKCEAYGNSSQDLINTAEWFGEFRRICKQRDIRFEPITRNEVKQLLCHRTSAVTDKHVNEAVAYHYGVETVKGKWTGILKGITSHAKAALAAGIAWMKHTGVN